MDAAQRLHAADMELARLRQMRFKGQHVTAAQLQRAEQRHRAAMKAWLRWPDDIDAPLMVGTSRWPDKIAACYMTLGDACPAVRTKAQRSMTLMPVQRDPAVARDAEQFEATLKAARIPDALHDGLWDIWVDNGPRAYSLVARFKDNGGAPSVRSKAAPGMVAIELPAAVVDQLGGPDAVAQLVARAAQSAQTPAGGLQLRDDQAAATLKAAPTRWVDDSGLPLARAVRDRNGNPI